MREICRADAQAGLQTVLVVGDCAGTETELDLQLPEIQAHELNPDSQGVLRSQFLGRASRPWQDLRAVAELRGFLRKFNAQVLHTHTFKAGLCGRRAAANEPALLQAHTYHGHVLRDYYARPFASLLRHLEARLARQTQCLFAVSPSCQQELHQLGVGEGRIQVLPSALNLEPFQRSSRSAARQRLGLDDEQTVLGFAGRMVAIKRPKMFQDMVQAMPETLGLMFGSGPLQPVTSDRLRHCGAPPNLQDYLPAMDLLVLPSKREGCPVVALEAFAAGVPVLGFAVPGLRDVLEEWGQGILVDEAQGVPGLVAGARRLLGDEGLRQQCIQQSRLGLHRFQAVPIAKAMATAYASVLAEKSTSYDAATA